MLSVLVPAYKNNKTLFRLVESIANQTISSKIEIIISDDNSNPPLDKNHIISKFGELLDIKWHYQLENLGVLGNAKFLANIANHRFAVFAQHDDYYIDDEFFERSITSAISDPRISFIFANAAYEDSGNLFFNCGIGIEIYDGFFFSKLFWTEIMTSWTSVIFDNYLLKSFGGFGVEYTINKEQGIQFSAYHQEEGMGFLYLLACDKVWVKDSTSVSIRGLPDTRFSISPIHPGKALKNDCLTFIYWNVAKMCNQHNKRGSLIATNVRALAGMHFGLRYVNVNIIRFFGFEFRSLLFVTTALFMFRFKRLLSLKIRLVQYITNKKISPHD